MTQLVEGGQHFFVWFLVSHLTFAAYADVISGPDYGRVVDNGPQIVSAGLISKDGYSKLCGPVSFENVLIKFRKELGISPSDPLTDIQNLISLYPAVVEHGILRSDFKALIEKYSYLALSRAVGVEIHVIGAVNFDLEQLKNMVDGHQAVILQIWWWRDEAFVSTNPWSVSPENGHWVTVIGYDSKASGRFLIQDPMHATPLFINLSAGYPAQTNDGKRIYSNEIVRYESFPPYLNPKGHTALVGDYLSLQLE